MHTGEDWQSEEMVRAEYALDDAAGRAYRDMYAADELLDEIAVNDERRAGELARAWQEYAQRDGAAPAWRAVLAKIAAGELTWERIAGGEVIDHPAVRAAVTAEHRKPASDDDDGFYDRFSVLRKR